MNNHIDYGKVAYLVLDPQGAQVHASNFQHLAVADAWGRNRTNPGHTVEVKDPEVCRCDLPTWMCGYPKCVEG